MKKEKLHPVLKRTFLLFSVFLISIFSNLHAQLDLLFERSYRSNIQQIAAGIATLSQSNLPQPLLGINLKYRVESHNINFRDQSRTAFSCFNASYFFKEEKQRSDFFKATSTDTSMLNSIQVPYDIKETVSYFTIELGKDYFLHTSKNEKLALYAGYLFGIFVPIYRGYYSLSEYDQMNYKLDVEENWKPIKKTSTANFKLGINLGTEVYVGTFGSVYLEATPFVKLFGERNIKKELSIPSRFFLGFNLGYRYEF
ncbi:MAG: hypothetical protein PHQ74_09680 [Crocinitomicaceae bacterium]|nr:hypothetical protein [Crocinitomicaceae bacterium]